MVKFHQIDYHSTVHSAGLKVDKLRVDSKGALCGFFGNERKGEENHQSKTHSTTLDARWRGFVSYQDYIYHSKIQISPVNCTLWFYNTFPLVLS